MALKPLFLEERLISQIKREAQKAGKDYPAFLSDRIRNKPRIVVRVVTKKTPPPEVPLPVPLRFQTKVSNVGSHVPTVHVEESTSIKQNEARASCGKCRGEVILLRTQLMTLRNQGRKVYCASCKGTSAQKSA